jgi:hypothetical protein
METNGSNTRWEIVHGSGWSDRICVPSICVCVTSIEFDNFPLVLNFNFNSHPNLFLHSEET